VFVHCRRGADRTGTVVACYRIGHDRWDGGKAIAEAKADGMSVFQVAMRRYVERYYVEQYGGQAPSLGIPAFMMPSPAR
jgi:protein-tyrosine phosphatase